jgi:predicted phosphoribosyltransferase
VAVAVELARSLALPLETWAVRKIGHPFNPEVAIGAVAPGGVVLWDASARAQLGLSPQQEHTLVAEQQTELARRQRVFGDPAAASLRHRCLIVVDDGVATGMSARAALQSLAQLGPERLILAVPVIDAAVVPVLEPLVDEVVALAVVGELRSEGEHFSRFEQLSDSDVQSLLASAVRLQTP